MFSFVLCLLLARHSWCCYRDFFMDIDILNMKLPVKTHIVVRSMTMTKLSLLTQRHFFMILLFFCVKLRLAIKLYFLGCQAVCVYFYLCSRTGKSQSSASVALPIQWSIQKKQRDFPPCCLLPVTPYQLKLNGNFRLSPTLNLQTPQHYYYLRTLSLLRGSKGQLLVCASDFESYFP